MVKEWSVKIIIGIAIAWALYLSSVYNYLLFHSIAEIFSIVIGYSLFMLACQSRNVSMQKFDYLIFIGISYFFISSIDFLHTLAYKGMPIFTDYDYYASEFWIAARYIESISLLLSFIILKYKKNLNFYLTFFIYSFVSTILIVSIIYFKTFPICFIEGEGQTSFKIISEYIICSILIADAILIVRNKYIFDNKVYKYIFWSVIITIASEFSFTIYTDVYGISNLLGHYFKLISFYLLYKAIIVTEIAKPYEIACNELKQRKKTLRMYKNLFDSIDECFCIIDVIYDSEGNLVDFRYVEVNSLFEQESGLENVKGKLISIVNPDFNENVLNVLKDVVLTGNPRRTIDEMKSLKQWYSSYIFRIDQEDNSRLGVLFRNITKEFLEKKEMEKNIEMQNEIFVNISHELKTPLNVIYSSIQLLELYSNKNSLDIVKNKVLRNIDVIKQNCYRFTKLINNIVDSSKMDLGFISLKLKNEDIVKVVENIVVCISEVIIKKELQIIFTSDVESKVFAFDLNKIERTMLNLISNAIKFSDKEDTIYVGIEDKGEFVEIYVKDTGIGIENKHLEFIFDRFYQVDKTLSRNAEGTGIGLSLVKLMVEMHGGKVSVESEIDVGSTFRVLLPVKTIEASNYIEQEEYRVNRLEMLKVEFSDVYNL